MLAVTSPATRSRVSSASNLHGRPPRRWRPMNSPHINRSRSMNFHISRPAPKCHTNGGERRAAKEVAGEVCRMAVDLLGRQACRTAYALLGEVLFLQPVE